LELRKDSAGIISDIAASFLSSNSLKSQQYIRRVANAEKPLILA
jgi:hypothetical protein